SPTYEVVIFATRQCHYYFDLDAIRIPHRSADRAGRPRPAEASRRYQQGNSGLGTLKAEGRIGHPFGKNPGDVWSISTATDRLGIELNPTYVELATRRLNCDRRAA